MLDPTTKQPPKLGGVVDRAKLRDEELQMQRKKMCVVASRIACAAAGIKYSDSHLATMERDSKDPKEYKKYSSDCRGHWINQGAGPEFAQLSFIGRALPKGTNLDKEAGLAQNRADLTSTHTTSSVLLDAARRFANKWARTRLSRAKRELGPVDFPTGSSCIECPTSKGGTLAYVAQSIGLSGRPATTLGSALDEVDSISDKMTEWALQGLQGYRAGADLINRAVALPERGLKTRIATVGQAWPQVLGHTVRKRMMKALRNTPGTYAPLQGNTMAEMEKIYLGGCGEVVVSTDLTRASDLLPHDLIRSIVDGLGDSGRISETEYEVLLALSGPQRVKYGQESVMTSRGILMGLPTTWVLLSLIHLFWLDQTSLSMSSSRRSTFRASICGDDALVCCSIAAAEQYKHIVHLCGGAASAGKHYESRSPNPLRGVFLEKLYEFQTRDGLISEITLNSAISLRGLTSAGAPRSFSSGEIMSVHSQGIRLLLAFDALAVAETIPTISRLVRNAYPWYSTYCSEVCGLVPGRRLDLGGYIIGDLREDDDIMSRELRDSGTNLSVALRREIDPSWRKAAALANKTFPEQRFETFPDSLESLPEHDSDGNQVYSWEAVDSWSVSSTVPFFWGFRMREPDGKPRVLTLRAGDIRKAIIKLRALGRATPSGLEYDVPRKTYRPIVLDKIDPSAFHLLFGDVGSFDEVPLTFE